MIETTTVVKEFSYMFDKSVYRVTVPFNMSQFFDFLDKSKPTSIISKSGNEIVKISEYHDFNSVICSVNGAPEKEKTYLYVWMLLNREPHKFYFN
jgi:hypothetical protein